MLIKGGFNIMYINFRKIADEAADQAYNKDVEDSVRAGKSLADANQLATMKKVKKTVPAVTQAAPTSPTMGAPTTTNTTTQAVPGASV
jgi:hypothetical protein